MEKKYAFIGLVLVITAAFAMLHGCSKEEVQIGQSPAADSAAGSIIVNALVIDQETKQPIEDVIVYMGSGFYSCHTGMEGKCSINNIHATGSHGLVVFKKGYNRFQNSTDIRTGENNFAIEIEKKSETPSSFTIEGKVVEIVTGKGTMSENHYLKIRADDGKEEYIFNEVGNNIGFQEFIGKKVRITGFREVGYIGWQHSETEGIYVESIEKIGIW